MMRQIFKIIKQMNYPFLCIIRLFLSSLPVTYYSHFVHQEYIAYLFRGVNKVIMSSQCETCFRILEFSVYRFLPLYSLLFFIILFVVYQLTKLLHHAKRQYSVIIGEYMTLASILIFLFALTYNSTLNLNYTMFSSFLILTPTYQLIYVIIGIVVVLVAGVLINDVRGK